MIKKVRLIFFMPVLVLGFILLFTSCFNENDNAITTPDTENLQTPQTTTQDASEAITATDNESSPDITEINDSIESETTGENKEDDNQTKKSINYTEKIIKIERVDTIYENIYTGSIDLEIDNSTGNIIGIIFLGYMEVKLYKGKSYPCENVMKGSITGNLDETTGVITGGIKSEFTGDGKDCFTGAVILDLSGNTIENGKFIEGGFDLPSGNLIYFQLKKLD